MFIVNILSAVIGFYSILILIRIILSWFGSMVRGKFIDFLEFVTDPYLNWWRRNLNLRIGVIDFSAVAGITALSIVQNILFKISSTANITIGIILFIIIIAIWNVISFIIGFYIIVLILRLIALLTSRDIYSPFWQIIDSISQPLLYKVNRILYGNNIGSIFTGIIVTIVFLAVVLVAGGIAVALIANIFLGLPL